MNEYELRYTTDSQFDSKPEGKNFRLSGYASVFNTRSEILRTEYGSFVEQVNTGAFTKTIKEADVRALWNHNADHVLGRSVAGQGSLRMAEDSTGLHYEVDLLDSEFNRSLHESIQRGDITQSSFGFATITDAWGFTDEEIPLRSLQEVQLFDVSPVTYPAYRDASIGTRALERLATKRDIDLAEVKQDLAKAIRGEAKPEQSTYVEPYFDPSDIIVIRGRLNRA